MMIAANIISMTILFAVPLLLVAMGGMFSEHSGVINIALEGMMIIGALFACFTLQGLDQSGFGPAQPQLSMFFAILVAGYGIGCAIGGFVQDQHGPRYAALWGTALLGGGSMGVVPGVMGVAAFAPPLDGAGNSVKAQKALAFIAGHLNLNVFGTTRCVMAGKEPVKA